MSRQGNLRRDAVARSSKTRRNPRYFLPCHFGTFAYARKGPHHEGILERPGENYVGYAPEVARRHGRDVARAARPYPATSSHALRAAAVCTDGSSALYPMPHTMS